MMNIKARDALTKKIEGCMKSGKYIDGRDGKKIVVFT